MQDYDVAVIGLGFTGLATAVSAVQAGFRVLGVDHSASRLTEIAEVAPGCGLTTTSEADLAAVLRAGRLSLRQTGAAGSPARVHVVCVPTPPGPDRGGNLQPLLSAVDHVAQLVRPGDLVLIQSTCPPGTTVECVAPLLALRSGLIPGADFHLAYSPVRLDPGIGRLAVNRIPRVVAGLSAGCTTASVSFLRHFTDQVVPVGSIATAELAKVFENAFRLVNISLVNELAGLCHAMGVDVDELIDAAATKPFGFLAHRPGPGAGGDCVPVSAGFLAEAARRYGVPASVVTAAATVNETMPDLVIDRVELLASGCLPDIRDSRVLVVGVTYKPDVPNVRRSAAVRMIEHLRERTEVGYADPYVPQLFLSDGSVLSREEPDPGRAGLVLLVTKHRGLSYTALSNGTTPVIDCSDGLPKLLNPHDSGSPSQDTGGAAHVW